MKRLDAEGLRKILDEHGIQYKEDLYKGGARFKLARCLFDENHQNCACFIAFPDGGLQYTCRHDSCQTYHFPDAITKIVPDYYKANSFDLRPPSSRPKAPARPTKAQAESTEHVQTPFFDGKSFLFNVLGDTIIADYHAKTYNGKLFFYVDGKYTPDKQVVGQTIRSYHTGMKKSQKEEVMDYLKDYAPVAVPANPCYVLFKNGIFDLHRRQLLPASPEYFITNCIPHNYDTAAYSQAAAECMIAWACDDSRTFDLLCEIIGYSMYRSARFKKAFVLLGDHDSGKSTFIRVLSALLGEENVSSLDLKELSERFNKADLSGTLCNLGDDISSDYISDSALFKKITGGSRIKGEYKGIDGFNFVSYCTLIFSANKMPKIEDKSGASTSRLIFVPFDANFKEQSGTRNVNLLDSLTTEESMQYFIKLGIDGLIRLVSSGGKYTMPEKAAKIMHDYEIENDSVLAFLDENAPEEWVLNHTPADVFSRYQAFCQRNNFICIGERMLNSCIRKCLRLTTKVVRMRDVYGNQVTERHYVKEE